MKLITTLIALPIITLIFIGGNLFSQSVSDLNNNPELKNERGMYSSVFLKENGDKEAIYSASPVHYKKNNKWELINTNIISTNDGYKNEQNVIQSFFPNNITSAGKIKLLINGLDEIKILAEKKLVLYNDQTNLQLLDINSTNSTAKIDNNSIIYTNIYPGISDEYTISNGKIKNDVILNSIPNLLNNVSNGYFGFQEVLELPSGWEIKPLDKTVGTLTSSPLIIFNDNGEHVLTIPEPIFFDKNGLESDGANMVQGKYLLKQDNNRWTLSTLVPVDWLKDINTKYPISIDPTVVLAGADGGWMSTVTLVNNPAFAFIGVCCGNAQHRAWVKFNTTSIPDNSCVTNVELEVFVNGVGGAAGELVHANDITGAPGPYGGVNAAVLTDMANGLYTSFILGAAGTYGYYDLGVNADALLQAQLPVNWFQVALIFDNEPSTNWKRLTATACNLRVTYNSCCPPIPAIPTITGPASVCAGDAVTYTVPAQAGAATYTWIVPAGATITGGQGTTSLNVTWNTTPGGNICVDWTDACPVTSPQTCLTVTVNPVPTVTVPANATYCAGDAVPIGSFTSMPAGATFAWSNSNTAIGLAASGTGNAPAFTATNATGNPITGTITVTPTLAGCVGTPVTYTITVNPVPTVTVPANATYCAGDAVPIGSFTSTPTGATFAWSNSNTAIGLAASGTGNAPAFTATNATGNPITGTITVTPTLAGCVGTPVSYTITVNPLPTVTVPANATYCAGDAVPIGSFTSTPAGATFAWTNSNTAIGLAASGTGNAPAFTATNATGSPITGTITVTPTLTGCIGTPVSYTITVNPNITPTFNPVATICSGDPLTPLPTTSTNGITGTWSPAINNTTTTLYTFTPTAGLCATTTTLTITVNPIPAAPTALSVTICPNNSTTLTATAPGGTYDWYDAAIGGTLLFTGAGYTTPVLIANTSYWVQTTVNGCTSPRTMVTVTIAAAISVNAGLDTTICDGTPFTLNVTPNGAGYSYVWDEPANMGFSTAFNPTVTPVATTTYTVTVTDPSNCVGTDMVTITVNPVPTVTVPANATYCDGDPVLAGTFTSTPAGATFTWSNSNPTIGLAAAGTGNAPAFTATNATGSPITATITVTPTLTGCVGTPVSYTITVNPIPTVTVPANATYCNGDPVPAGTFISVPAGGTFTWSNSDPTIGLAATGTGNTPAFTATNATGSPVTATITVTPTVNGCLGAPVIYTITVNPVPTVSVPANAAYCNNDPVPAGTFTSMPAGGSFAWTNSNPTIGLAVAGTGNTPAFTAINATGNPIIATITVTPTVNGCAGSPITYTITINPGAMANVATNITACPGDLVPASTFTSTPAGGTFTWTNSNPTIGLAAAGTGNTPAFTAINTTGNPIFSTVSVVATASGCPGPPSTYNITINPIVTGSTNAAICQGDSISIGGVFVSTAGSYLETLTSSFGCDSILTTILTVNIVSVATTPVVICQGDSILIEGNYYSAATSFPFTYTSSFGCDSIVIYDITVAPLPSFTVTGSAFINLGESVNLAVMPGIVGTTYSWNPPVGLSCLFCQNPIATPAESIWYYVTVTNANGCSTIDSVYIDVDPSSNIYVPNIFSPNEDGNNDIYLISGKGINQFNLAIYNRWGQKVFESDDIEKGWDGTKNGSPLNQGVFVYKLNVSLHTGKTIKQTGNITLVR